MIIIIITIIMMMMMIGSSSSSNNVVIVIVIVVIIIISFSAMPRHFSKETTFFTRTVFLSSSAWRKLFFQYHDLFGDEIKPQHKSHNGPTDWWIGSRRGWRSDLHG